MVKVVLFGASTLGQKSYFFLKRFYEISYYCDNDINKFGKKLNGIQIINPNKLRNLGEIKIIITSSYYQEISKQLIDLGFNNFKIVFSIDHGYKICDIDEVLDNEGNINLNRTIDGFMICDLTQNLLIPKNKYILNMRHGIKESLNMNQIAIDNSSESWNTFWQNEMYIDEYNSENRKTCYKQIFDLVSKEFVFGKIIDVGCGSGYFINLLLEKGFKNAIYGTDFSYSAIEFCKCQICKANFSVEDIYNLSFENMKFENVLCMEVLEHLLDPARALKELYRITAENGRLILTIPNGTLDNYIGHVNFWSEVEFSQFVSEVLGAKQNVNSYSLNKLLVFIIQK